MIFAVGSRMFKTISGLIISHKKKHETKEFPSREIQQFSGFSPILLILSHDHNMAVTASYHHENIKRQEVNKRFPASPLPGV